MVDRQLLTTLSGYACPLDIMKPGFSNDNLLGDLVFYAVGINNQDDSHFSIRIRTAGLIVVTQQVGLIAHVECKAQIGTALLMVGTIDLAPVNRTPNGILHSLPC